MGERLISLGKAKRQFNGAERFQDCLGLRVVGCCEVAWKENGDILGVKSWIGGGKSQWYNATSSFAVGVHGAS